MKVDHITAVVGDVEVAARVLGRLLDAAPVASVTLPGMAIRSFRIGDAELHLNAPTGPGPVEDHHRVHGPGYHHLALGTDDLDAALAELAAKGFAALGAPVSTAPGLREVFLDPATTGGLLIQLVERRAAPSGSYELDAAAIARMATELRGRR